MATNALTNSPVSRSAQACVGGDAAVFTGDLIHSPIQARYPELVMRVDTDRDQAVRTRRNFFERYCDTTRCAARCTSRRPRSAISSAGATASAWNTQKPERRGAAVLARWPCGRESV